MRLTATAALLLVSGVAAAHTWQVEITNVTPGQTFTPLLAASHSGNVDFFNVGEPASEALATMAESGNTGPLQDILNSSHGVGGIATHNDLLGPGETVTLYLEGWSGQRLSIAGMLIPTNDTFIGVDSEFLPTRGSKTIQALAYDAGSEANDQNCANIPGPRCMGAADSAPADTDEGFVHVGNGFHTLGESDVAGEVLQPAHYDWNNPVAIIKVRRVYGHKW